MARHLAGIPADWPGEATARTARMCLAEAGLKRPMAAADSTGAGTDRYRGMIEGIFGAEKSEGHGLHCRFRKAATRGRFGLIKAIGRSIEVPSRLRAAKETGMEVRQYVRQSYATTSG